MNVKNYVFTPSGVCSQKIQFGIDDEGKLHDVRFTSGCNGNLKAIGRLVEGRDAGEVAQILEGNQCGMRGTSCADQFSHAITQAIAQG